MAEIQVASFKCIEVWSGKHTSDTTSLGVLLMHGYGADPSQFTQVVDILLQANPALANRRIRWVFPASPTQDGPVGSEWFPLDLMGWMGAFMGGNAVLAAKLRDTPAGMNEASEQVIALLAELCKTTNGAASTLQGWCIGGFSQGAMMTCSVVSRLGLADQDRTGLGTCTSPAGMLILSGMCMNIEQWYVLLCGCCGCFLFLVCSLFSASGSSAVLISLHSCKCVYTTINNVSSVIHISLASVYLSMHVPFLLFSRSHSLFHPPQGHWFWIAKRKKRQSIAIAWKSGHDLPFSGFPMVEGSDCCQHCRRLPCSWRESWYGRCRWN